jgi:DUF4097 and DUF4098 domain-containing protein YvlB
MASGLMKRQFQTRWIPGALAVCLLLPSAMFARRKFKSLEPGSTPRRLVGEKTGAFATREGQRLRLVTDLGDVHIQTNESNEVSYHVRVESDEKNASTEKWANAFLVTARSGTEGVFLRGQAQHREDEGHLWITFDVIVPSNYNLEVSTGAGTIDTGDIEGRLGLSTGGGDITIGNITGTARLETGGGHIQIKDVSDDVIATTGGGHISVGRVGGNATLHTGGGHIHFRSVGKIARIETGGGNVSLEHAGAVLVATTGGGQIEVGEASGTIRARSGGGGIRVTRLSGPTQLETGDGSIYLTQVQSAVRASTGAGGITAWFGPDAKLAGTSELESGEGDIIVYLPKLLPVTIDAQIQLGDEHHVIVDPAFPLTVSYIGSEGAHAVRAEGALNGGGVILKLRTVAGNIRLILSDTCLQLQKQIYKQQMEHLQRQVEFHLRTITTPKPAPAPKPSKPEKPD